MRLIDFEKPENNDFLAVNQFTVVEGQHHRRPDIVISVNGIPLGRVLGDETLRQIPRELVEAVRKNVSIDWTVKESARAKIAGHS